MTTAGLALELACAVGLTIVLTLSRIATPIRRFVAFVWAWVSPSKCPAYCSQCVGFWVGLAVGAWTRALEATTWGSIAQHAILMAFATSILALVASTWLRSQGEYTDPPE